MLFGCLLAAGLPGLISNARAQTGTFEVLLQFFAPSTGQVPQGALIQGSDGNFYGTATTGGKNNTGVVYKITPGGTLTVLHTFDAFGTNDVNTGGGEPSAALVRGSDGNFYGTAAVGGTAGNGTIFKLTPGGTFTVLHNFSARDSNTGLNADGIAPNATMIQGRDGNFYGTTDGAGPTGAGTIFKITASGTFTTIYKLVGYAQLVEGSDGNFYGATGGGGTEGDGMVFKITSAGTLTTLHSFSGTDGFVPSRILTLGSDGNFYGTTIRGGTHNTGTIFKITAGGTLTTLHNFSAENTSTDENADGINPTGGVIQGKDGNFYGTATAGGMAGFGSGTLYKITPAGAFTLLHTFTAEDDRGVNTDGAEPMVPLLKASDGTLYGVASRGGQFEEGTLFKFTSSPVISSAATATGTVNKAFSYQITATNSPTKYGASGLPSGLSVNTATGLISGTPKAAGTSSVTLTAVNSFGTGAKTLTLTVKPATPVITSATSATGTERVTFSYQITATNSPTKYGESGLPSGLSISQTTGKISGTPTKAGTYSVTIAAFNSAGSGSAKLTLTIKAGKPVITSSLTATATVGAAFSYQITATDTPTKYGESGLPAGLTINQTTGKISGKPTKAGTYNVTIAAFNSTGSGSAKLALTVKAAVSKPVITSSLNPPSRQGVPFTYQITATNNPTSYGESGIPAGLTINQATGKITGTPTKAGTYKVIVAASNAGGKGTATLTLVVKPPA